jgi:carboxylesterase type B
MRSTAALATLFALSASGAALAQPAPVETEAGLVQGAVEGDLAVYRGIPFAAPPVGDLRRRPPQPAEKWEGVRETTAFAPDPCQGMATYFANFVRTGDPNGEGVPEWPQFGTTQKVMYLDAVSQAGPEQHRERSELLGLVAGE